MEPSSAQLVLGHLTAATGALQDAIRALDNAGSSSNEQRYRERIAMLISLIGTGLYRPLYHQHPALCPDAMRFMLDRPPSPADWPFGHAGRGDSGPGAA